MKERLVEDWLIRINERGYELAFCQTLISKRFKILRCGHSPTEHGKDIIAISPQGIVYAYQLKSGDMGQAELLRHHAQLNMLVEARPCFPGLPDNFEYKPLLVTTGEFKQPALSLIAELNNGWRTRGLPTLDVINGRQLQAVFLELSNDFWPVAPPDIRKFRELYLVTGKGDIDLNSMFAFLRSMLSETDSNADFVRQISAMNIFSTYVLSEFYVQKDHWSVFQGHVLCAALIAWAGQTSTAEEAWLESYEIAKHAALAALTSLAHETLEPDALVVRNLELDKFSRTRNTVAVGATACACIINSLETGNFEFESRFVEILVKIFPKHVLIWGESAFPHFLLFFWIFERAGQHKNALLEILGWIRNVAEQNTRDSSTPLADPYVSADDALAELFHNPGSENPGKVRASVSYTLIPALLLAVRRGQRAEICRIWDLLSEVMFTHLSVENSRDVLLWKVEQAEEVNQMFNRPQKWSELVDLAFKDQRDRVPPILRADLTFALMFLLVFPHCAFGSLVKFLDDQISGSVFFRE